MSGNLLLGSLIFMPIIAAVIGYLIGKRNKSVRDYFVIIITIIEFIGFLFFFIVANKEYRSIPLLNEEIQNIFYTQFVWNNFRGMGIHFVLDGFRATFCFIAAIMWMMTTIFSKEYFLHHKNRNRYYFFTLMTLGSTIGVFLSADLFTTFIFFEIMSFTSYVWVAQEEKKEALKAAETYLAVAVIGGLVMLFGIFLLQNTIHTLEISQLLEKSKLVANKGPLYIAGGCILFGFGAKAGVFPLHIWLPKAHPVAPAPASALLSGILTKTGVFGILIVSCNLFFGDELWGRLILVLGILTMFGGALLALFSVDIKRTLACSSMSQIGFILIGIATQNYLGKENALAAIKALSFQPFHLLYPVTLHKAAYIIFELICTLLL